jgi:prepilin-type N-terminal cleavage/methylation domain-containing protein
MAKTNFFLKCGKARSSNEKGFTLAELLVAIGLSALFTGFVFAALISSRQICTSNTANQELQQTTNVVMNKIIKGGLEPGGIFRLSEATSYTIASINDLHFFGTDGNERRYFQTGASLMYRHPTANGTQDETLYTAPTGTTLTLRFWTLAGSSYTNIAVGIDVGLARVVNGRNASGSATTMINIRNHVT